MRRRVAGRRLIAVPRRRLLGGCERREREGRERRAEDRGSSHRLAPLCGVHGFVPSPLGRAGPYTASVVPGRAPLWAHGAPRLYNLHEKRRSAWQLLPRTLVRGPRV